MGCDGGTIPKRCELVPEKKKKEKKDKHMSRIARWQNCALSNEKLTHPIVGCRKGRLYNKEAVLEHILSKKRTGEFAHIKKLKDVRELTLQANPAHKEAPLTRVELETVSAFVCPLTNIDMNGKYEFVFLFSCGCVLSRRAFKEISSSVCPVCGLTFSSDDVININPPEKDSDEESEDIKTETTEKESEKINDSEEKQENEKSSKKPVKSSEEEEKSSKDSGKVGKSKSQKSKAEKDSKSKEKTLKKSEKSQQTDDKLSDFAKKNLAVEKIITKDAPGFVRPAAPDAPQVLNPKETKAYKSLFTSSEEFKNKPKEKKAYWVSTFNYSV